MIFRNCEFEHPATRINDEKDVNDKIHTTRQATPSVMFDYDLSTKEYQIKPELIISRKPPRENPNEILET